MSTMTLATYKTAVRRTLGNIPTSFPQISDAMDERAINSAANAIIRRYPTHFPETRNYAWQIGPTVVGQNSIALPAASSTSPKVLEIHRVVTNALETTPSSAPSSWAEVDEQFVAPIPVHIIGQGGKDSDIDGYPSQWERQGSNILYWPPTRTGYTCYLRAYGQRGEYLITSAQSFLVDADFDDAIIFDAAAILCTSIGWVEKASALRVYVKSHMDMIRPAGVGELVTRPARFTMSGMPQ